MPESGENRTDPFMAREIERKFLVDDSRWSPRGAGRRFVQGYVMVDDDRSLRVRHEPGQGAWVTLKVGGGTLDRSEFDYAVPEADAVEMLALCEGRVVDKTRYTEPAGRHTFEIDVFAGRHTGLVLAEVELADVNETFERPTWLGDEVTGDARYLNARLAMDDVFNG
ncbi:MAG: CYTH domain-containing protein [Pseudomonadota bacterium]